MRAATVAVTPIMFAVSADHLRLMRTVVRSFIILFLFIFGHEVLAQVDSACISAHLQKKVTGTSMEGVINQGSVVYLLEGFYKCNPVGRNDVVAYDYAGSKIPVIKMAKGIPGDVFSMPTLDAANYCIVINNDTLKEIGGNPYSLNQKRYNLLELYETEFGGRIPADTYLLLGSHSGTTDSGRFGFVGRSDLLGKIVYTEIKK